MSRSKRDILDTEKMLERLTELLCGCWSDKPVDYGTPLLAARADAESLRRISMTLRRWHELECGDSNAHNSFCLVRGKLTRTRHKTEQGLDVRKDTFEHDDNGKPYLEIHHNSGGVSYSPMLDREAGARKRLAAIMARYPSLTAYVQGDPRGCALYILKPGDVPEGADASAYYSRGLAVYR